MTDVTIDLNELIGIIQQSAKTEEKILHIEVENALKEKLRQQTKLLESVNRDWDDLLETIGFLFMEAPSTYFDEDGYVVSPNDILEFAKQKMDRLEMRLEILEKAVVYVSDHAYAGLPHLISFEGRDAFEVPTHVEANNELGAIRDYCSSVLKTDTDLTDKYRRAARVGLYEAAKKLLVRMDKSDPNAKFVDDEYMELHNAITYYETTGNSTVLKSEVKGYIGEK